MTSVPKGQCVAKNQSYHWYKTFVPKQYHTSPHSLFFFLGKWEDPKCKLIEVKQNSLLPEFLEQKGRHFHI